MTNPPQPRQMTAQQAFDAALSAERAGRSAEAERLHRAVFDATGHLGAAINLTLLLEAQARDAEAEVVYRRALAKSPGDQRLRWQYSLFLLKRGRYAEAWPLFEDRTWNDPGRRPQLSFPEWTGEPIRSLLIVGEQGLGDQIQNLRYATLLRDRGVAVTILSHPALAMLFAKLGLKVIAAAGQVDIPRHDAWALSGSLPHRMGTTLETIPAAPYLPATPGGQGVGFVGQGNPAHVNDANRSLPADLIAQVLSWPGVVSLQPEHTKVRDVADTAALVDGLELVITVDTVTAHLAGAMGKPTWLLLPFNPDWRWLRDRADSPWYPSIRIFRQPKPGDWASVLADVKRALDEPGNRP